MKTSIFLSWLFISQFVFGLLGGLIASSNKSTKKKNTSIPQLQRIINSQFDSINKKITDNFKIFVGIALGISIGTVVVSITNIILYKKRRLEEEREE